MMNVIKIIYTLKILSINIKWTENKKEVLIKGLNLIFNKVTVKEMNHVNRYVYFSIKLKDNLCT